MLKHQLDRQIHYNATNTLIVVTREPVTPHPPHTIETEHVTSNRTYGRLSKAKSGANFKLHGVLSD